MSRFLFVVPPFLGHVNPVLAVADELARHGHEVAWAGDCGVLDRVVLPWTSVYHCETPATSARPPALRGFAALKFLWEQSLIPLATAMLPGVLEAVAEFRPDIVVADQQALAGALAAERLRLPWATSATTSAELTDPLGDLPKVREWLTGLLKELSTANHCPSAVDLRFSPHLVLAFTTTALLGEPARLPDSVCFVGPARVEHDVAPLPWQALDPHRPLVFVSLGTANADAGERFLVETVEALRRRPDLQAVVVDPTGAVLGAPKQVIVRGRVAQLAVLARANVVVCHAGHNTVCEALGHGVPLVVAPIRDDQPIIADQVTSVGAAVRLRFDHARAEHIGSAIDTVLTEPSYRANAQRVQRSFQMAGGAVSAAWELTRLAKSARA
ncbi:MAG TPA: nucleotide disphospho-sugar-binding domain-containing protein [Mycobacteriales bacterium]|nr:nucleotide disphospho-sugar-binding domain-containing protein [Mycobacteriales bacterium]